MSQTKRKDLIKNIKNITLQLPNETEKSKVAIIHCCLKIQRCTDYNMHWINEIEKESICMENSTRDIILMNCQLLKLECQLIRRNDLKDLIKWLEPNLKDDYESIQMKETYINESIQLKENYLHDLMRQSKHIPTTSSV